MSSARPIKGSKMSRRISGLMTGRTLHMQILEAHAVESPKTSFKPYVVVNLNLEKKTKFRTTKPKTKDRFPVWYDKTIWALGHREIEDINNLEIYFDLKLHKTMGKGTKLGSFKVFAKDLLATHNFVDMWFAMHEGYVADRGEPHTGGPRSSEDNVPRVRVQMQYLLPGMKTPVFDRLDMTGRDYADDYKPGRGDVSSDSDSDSDEDSNTGVSSVRNSLTWSQMEHQAIRNTVNSIVGRSVLAALTTERERLLVLATQRCLRTAAARLAAPAVRAAYLSESLRSARQQVSTATAAAAEERRARQTMEADWKQLYTRETSQLEGKLAHAVQLADTWQEAARQTEVDVRGEMRRALEAQEAKWAGQLRQTEADLKAAVAAKDRSEKGCSKWEETAKTLGAELDAASREISALRTEHDGQIREQRTDYEVQLSEARMALNKASVEQSRVRREKQEAEDKLQHALQTAQDDADEARTELAELRKLDKNRRQHEMETADQLERRDEKIERLSAENKKLSGEVEELLGRLKEVEGKAKSDEMNALRAAREAREAAARLERERAQEERNALNEKAKTAASRDHKRAQHLLEEKEEEERLARRRALELTLERQAADIMRSRVFKK